MTSSAASKPGPIRALPAALLLATSLLFVGGGPRNGDVAGYLWQVSAGAPWDRATHAGYVGLASPVVALLGPGRGPLALDLLSVGACVLAAAAWGWRAPTAGFALAAVLLPVAAFGEVDPVWLACLVVASGSGTVAAAALVALGVAVSPAALLGLPWLCVARGRDAGLLVATAATTVAVLTLASAGAWWVGERGVLASDWSSLPRVPGAWLLHLAWPVVLASAPAGDARSAGREAASLAPLLLLPADVPGWVLVGVAAARRLTDPPSRGVVLAVAAQAVLALWWAGADRARFVDDNRAIGAVATTLDPDRDGVIAPFTTGARLSYARTGDPYGLRWHPEGRWLRDQRATWCARGGPERVWRWDGRGLVPADDAGSCP